MFHQKLVSVSAFPVDLVPFIERGRAVGRGDEGLLLQAELALLGLLAVRRCQSLDAPFHREGDVIILQLTPLSSSNQYLPVTTQPPI